MRRLAASPGRVFDAWLDPEKAAGFLFATPTGTMVRAEIDPRVGGAFTFVDRRDGMDVLHTGRYMAIDRPYTLAFTLSVPQFSPDETTVRIAVAPMDLGSVVTLTHDGVSAHYAERMDHDPERLGRSADAVIPEFSISAAYRAIQGENFCVLEQYAVPNNNTQSRTLRFQENPWVNCGNGVRTAFDLKPRHVLESEQSC